MRGRGGKTVMKMMAVRRRNMLESELGSLKAGEKVLEI